jgi:hypothetical protein
MIELYFKRDGEEVEAIEYINEIVEEEKEYRMYTNY